jgi:broad specificity phosphatase PhoE
MRSTSTFAAKTILCPAFAGLLVLAPNFAPAPAADNGPGTPLASQPDESLGPATTTVFLVRHAEKAAAGDPEFDPQTPADPPLNAAGRARADDLARTLEEAGVTAIFASEFARTQQTVAPLAARVGLEVTVHPARDTAGLAELVATAHAGGVVVISGHSNTVPALVEALGAGTVDPIEEAWEYDNLYVVAIEAPGEARVSTLKYGVGR